MHIYEIAKPVPMGEGDVLKDKSSTTIRRPSRHKPKSQQIALGAKRVQLIINIEKTIRDI